MAIIWSARWWIFSSYCRSSSAWADAGDGVRLVAVHVDQRLEAVLLAAVEQPVNGALLVDLQMVFIEVVQEVIADDLAGGGAFAAQRVGNEPQVFFQRVRAVDGLEPVDEHGHDVVGEILVIGDGQNAVLVRGVSDVLAGIPRAAGERQAGLVQRIAPHHAAHGVGNQAADVAAEVCLAHGHVLVVHVGGQFVLQAVDVDENAVQLFLVGFQRGKAVSASALPVTPAVGKEHVMLVDGGGDEGVALEVPGGFEGVPIGFRVLYQSWKLAENQVLNWKLAYPENVQKSSVSGLREGGRQAEAKARKM